MLLSLQHKLNIYPFYKYANNKKDRLWYITSKTNKVYLPLAISITENSDYTDIRLYKLYLGPLVIGFGRRIKETSNGMV